MIAFIFILGSLIGQVKGFSPKPPNFVVILVDDQRWDALGHNKETYFLTPALDKLAKKGMYFPNAFVSLAICSPSRAAILSGQYGSKNGVMDMNSRLKQEENALGNRLKSAGYQTAVFGKWHLPNTPKDLGFEHEFIFNGITDYWNVTFSENGRDVQSKGFVDDVTITKATEYLANRSNGPFFLFVNTFAPHMDRHYDWPIDPATSNSFSPNDAPVPVDWNTNFAGKPAYLKNSRPHTRALEYGYGQPGPIKTHVFKYALANEAMDRAVGELANFIAEERMLEDTYVIVLGDNGWFMAEHGLTSKVLAYEESIRIPFFVLGPHVKAGKSEEMVMNTDVFSTILHMAGLGIPDRTDGKSLRPALLNNKPLNRPYVFYEAPLPVHGTYPHYAIRTKKWKYIITYDVENDDQVYFEELYDLTQDPKELRNVIGYDKYARALEKLREMARKEINLSKTNQSNL